MVHNKVDHKFAFSELEWDVKENLQRLSSLSILLYQRRKIVHRYNYIYMRFSTLFSDSLATIEALPQLKTSLETICLYTDYI